MDGPFCKKAGLSNFPLKNKQYYHSSKIVRLHSPVFDQLLIMGYLLINKR